MSKEDEVFIGRTKQIKRWCIDLACKKCPMCDVEKCTIRGFPADWDMRQVAPRLKRLFKLIDSEK